MSVAPAKMLVYVSDQAAWIKIIGRANVAASMDFKRLLSELIERGVSRFVLDLSECLFMDSTFLGVLAGFGQKATLPQNGNGNGRPIELFNANPRITELLENVGVANLFKLRHGDLRPAGSGLTERSTRVPEPVTREEITHTCLEAHRTLMALNPDNISKFKDVTQFLAEDLKKIKAGK